MLVELPSADADSRIKMIGINRNYIASVVPTGADRCQVTMASGTEFYVPLSFAELKARLEDVNPVQVEVRGSVRVEPGT